MKKRLLSVTMAVFMFLGLSLTAMAEEAKPEAAKPAAMTVDQLKELLGMSIYLQGGYTYNFRNPDSQENELRVFDHKANSFTLDLAQLQFVKDAPVGGMGYKLKVSAGETAKFIHSRGLGVKDGQAPADTDAFDLTEAFLQYNAPLGKGLKFTLGKFVTYHGAEVIEARDNLNYSRSFLFNYAIPFTHTGLMVSYPFSDTFTANFHVINGWDNTDDNNTGKTFGLSFGWTPIEQLAMNFNFMYGPEQRSENSNNRFLFDWVGTIKPVKNLSFVLNTDYATEQKDPNANGADSKWYGVAGYVKYDFSDLFSLTLRGEFFNDRDGVRTGTAQTLKEITFTPEFRLAKGLILRPEYRYDWSEQSSFNGGKDKNQHTIALGVMYTW
ncbi:MAG: porin [Deltaproteobacteria bacterium]|nr:porin [Deltaproteobacteria bacterium]